MKKIIIAALLVAFAATSSFAGIGSASQTAAGEGDNTVSGYKIIPNVLGLATASPTPVGKTSNGVYFGWNTATTGYSMVTQHVSGVKTIGTASDSTAITWKPAVKAAATPALATPTTASVYAVGWSVM